MEPRYLSYEELSTGSQRLAEQIWNKLWNKSDKPNIIVGLSRGGLFTAVIMSHMLKLPMRTMHCTSILSKGDDKEQYSYIPNVRRKIVLLVDDIWDSGETLLLSKTRLEENGNQVHTTTVYLREGYTQAPDFWHEVVGKDWLTFPWELSLSSVSVK